MAKTVEKILLGLLVYLLSASGNCGEKMEIRCPEFCECDIFQNLRRAVCQNKRLVSIELNIPPQAQILDISDNQISELGDKIFLEIGITDLRLLNISHNKIRQIHFNGFEGLSKLKTLDLSFNAIEYFTQAWFVSLSSLQELYLRGNKLKSINEEPLINLKTLKVLDISKCGITHLDENIFTMVPNLEVLDISDNYVQRFRVDVLKPLTKLALLKALNNNFNCKERVLVQVKNYIRKSKISYEDPCLADAPTLFTINSKIHKFEKMLMASEIEVTTSMQPKNSWIFDDEDENKTKIIEVCSHGTKSDVNGKSLLMEIMESSPWMVVSITFVYGVFSGMVIACAFNLCIKRKSIKNIERPEIPDGSFYYTTRSTQSLSSSVSRRDKTNEPSSKRSNSILYTTLHKARRQMSRESTVDDDFDETLVMNEFDFANSTPVQERKIYS